MKFWIIRFLLFDIMCALLLYMGHWPTEWEYWAVIVCGAGIGAIECIQGKNEE